MTPGRASRYAAAGPLLIGTLLVLGLAIVSGCEPQCLHPEFRSSLPDRFASPEAPVSQILSASREPASSRSANSGVPVIASRVSAIPAAHSVDGLQPCKRSRAAAPVTCPLYRRPPPDFS